MERGGDRWDKVVFGKGGLNTHKGRIVQGADQPRNTLGERLGVFHYTQRGGYEMIDNLSTLVEQLVALAGSDRLYNPYSGDDWGSEARRANLMRYLSDMQNRQPDTVLVFEAPG